MWELSHQKGFTYPLTETEKEIPVHAVHVLAPSQPLGSLQASSPIPSVRHNLYRSLPVDGLALITTWMTANRRFLDTYVDVHSGAWERARRVGRRAVERPA
jgi:hypothetical protein